MRQERRVPDEEWFIPCFLNEIVNRLEPVAANAQTDVAVTAAALGIAVGHAVGKATALVIALPPFAALMADIALLFQDSRQRGNPINQRNLFLKPLGIFR